MIASNTDWIELPFPLERLEYEACRLVHIGLRIRTVNDLSGIDMRKPSVKATVVAFCLGLSLVAGALGAEDAGRGHAIYQKLCVECHGAHGEGVKGKYDDPLTGDKSVARLQRIIHKSMPDEKPKLCEGDDALAVAQYIYDEFYSPAAQARNMPARIELSRLTVRQFQNSVADLVSSFSGGNGMSDRRGLRGQYFSSRSYNGKHKAFDRIDPQISFHFADGVPEWGGTAEQKEKGGGFKAEEFSMTWSGSVIVEDAGEYEFTVRTENGFKLWVNSSGEPTIDGWVALGGMPQSHSAKVFLLGGRRYPIKLDFFKFKDKTASIELRWTPPRKVDQIIPERSLSPDGARPILAVATPFPPDDSSVGYPRGAAVSKAWDEAVTRAAIEAANVVVRHLNGLAKTSDKDPDRERKVKAFCREFASRAFRRPLSDDLAALYVDRLFEGAPDLETGVKRAVLLALKSPRFLFPDVGGDNSDGFAVATRLALGLWDSLPDAELLKAAGQGRLQKADEVRRQAERMLRDPRARAKLREFFHQWLKMDEVEDLAKNAKRFPGFDELIVSDLRTSLDLFVESVLWSDASDYRQILLANHLFVNRRLAKFYGFEEPKKPGFQKVSFDSGQRTGVVTHPYLLTSFAYTDSTSPIHRGVFITRNLLGRTLKPPPIAVSFGEQKFKPNLTMREKVTELTKPRACQNCHAIINPLGFSLEHYDAVGRFRTREDDVDKPIDAVSEYQTDDGEIVKLKGARDLAEFAANSASAQRGFVIQLFNHVAKQPVQAYGETALADLRNSFAASDTNMSKLLAEVAVRFALGAPAERDKRSATFRPLIRPIAAASVFQSEAREGSALQRRERRAPTN